MTYSGTPEIECPECDGYGWVGKRLPRLGGGAHEVNCEACNGKGWRAMTPDEEADAAESAYERQMEDYYGGSSPVTLDEQHRAAWAQKQELRR